MSTADPAAAAAADGDLIAGLDRAWRMLAAAVDDRDSPLRTPVVITAGERADGVVGGRADGRILVLRRVDRAAAGLTFFTDIRAAKVAAIVADPAVAVVAYDPVAALQLRLHSRATIAATGRSVDAAWSTVPSGARRSYRTAAGPGTVAESSDAAGRLGDHDGRGNFAVIEIVVDEIEWLELAPAGHRRARHRRADGWLGDWLVP